MKGDLYNHKAIRATALTLAVVLGSVSCSAGSSDSSMASKEATTTEPRKLTGSVSTTILPKKEEPTDRSQAVLDCMFKSTTAIDTEHAKGKKDAPIAMGFRLYQEAINDAGVRGVEVLINPSITKCELPEGESFRVFNTSVVLGRSGVSGYEATGVASLDFMADGTYGLRGSGGAATIITGKDFPGWDEDGFDPNYTGEPTRIGINPEVMDERDGGKTSSGEYREFWTAQQPHQPVMKREFIPNKTLDEAIEEDREDRSSETTTTIGSY